MSYVPAPTIIEQVNGQLQVVHGGAVKSPRTSRRPKLRLRAPSMRSGCSVSGGTVSTAQTDSSRSTLLTLSSTPEQVDDAELLLPKPPVATTTNKSKPKTTKRRGEMDVSMHQRKAEKTEIRFNQRNGVAVAVPPKGLDVTFHCATPVRPQQPPLPRTRNVRAAGTKSYLRF